MSTLLLQLSDLHIREPGARVYGRIDTARYLRQATDHIARLPQRPDAIVISGDLCDSGKAVEYEYLRQLLDSLTMPIYLMVGNHDSREQLRAAFVDHLYLGTTGFVQYSVAIGAMQLIALDTSVPQAAEGELCAERLQWLSEQLDASRGRPVVIAMHHPPFATLIGPMDEIGLVRGAVEFEALVARHPNVERIVCGHLHRAIQVRFGGTIAATVPSTAHQVTLNLSPDAPLTWTLEPAGFALHVWPESGRLVSHAVASGGVADSHPFEDG